MKTLSLLKFFCLLGSSMACLSHSAAAESRGGEFGVAVTYNLGTSNTVGGSGFATQGGSFQMHDRLWHGLGAVGSLSGLHTGSTPAGELGLDLITATFGPRYTWSPARHRIQIFGETLGGGAWGFNSMFPGGSGVVSHSSSSALQIGGGLNVPLSSHVALRAFQADWLRTALPNATTNVQNNLLLGFGLSVHLK